MLFDLHQLCKATTTTRKATTALPYLHSTFKAFFNKFN